jgi:acetoin utilization deacetylase AcuC-like enzyme
MNGAVRLVRRWMERLRPSSPPPVWYHDAYRLPLADVEARAGIEPRRADLVIWHLVDRRVLTASSIRYPTRISYRDLARVHTPELLESLTTPSTLARIFAVDATHLPVDEILATVRLACMATVEAAREAVRTKRPAVNLLGGFHHAAPGRAGGLCPVNDIAVAVAVLRGEGWDGDVTVLDLDAHPPDGTAECFRGDPRVWIGSLSASDWGPIEGGRVDETVLPVGATDGVYLRALDGLLARVPETDLAFVIAGGDVLAGDRLGRLGLTLDGVRRRDRRVAEALAGRASVWLPGGGYHADSWKVLSGTVLVLSGRADERIPRDYDPLSRRFAKVAAALGRDLFAKERAWFTEDDLLEALGAPRSEPPRILGFYTREGLEYALQRYGILDHVRRLGYDDFHVSHERSEVGERIRLFGRADGEEHLLMETDLSRATIADRKVLFVNWLTLRHPIGRFTAERPKLPGQEVPGLGLAREACEILTLMAARLGLDGVAFRPAWYHVAYAMRDRMRFVDPHRQARFEAMLRDLAGLDPLSATLAVAGDRVRLDGAPYAWEADDMVVWTRGDGTDRDVIDRERDAMRFAVATS